MIPTFPVRSRKKLHQASSVQEDQSNVFFTCPMYVGSGGSILALGAHHHHHVGAGASSHIVLDRVVDPSWDWESQGWIHPAGPLSPVKPSAG